MRETHAKRIGMTFNVSISFNFETDIQLKTFVYGIKNYIRIDLYQFIFKLPDLFEMYFINIFIGIKLFSLE